MTGQPFEYLPEDHPARFMAELQLNAMADEWRCRHCDGRAAVVASSAGLYIEAAIEHGHELGCPLHDNNLPTYTRE